MGRTPTAKHKRTTATAAERERCTAEELAVRVARADKLVRSALSTAQTTATLAKEFGVSTRQARRYIDLVYEQWDEDSVADAPHRRDRIYKQLEALFQKAIAAEDFKAAATVGGLLVKMASGFVQHDPARAERLRALGSIPVDGGGIVLYAQRVMALFLGEVVANDALDPERKLRWVTELGSKIQLAAPRATMEERVLRAEKLAGLVPDDGPEGPGPVGGDSPEAKKHAEAFTRRPAGTA